MPTCLIGREEDVACIAGRVLLAWRGGKSVDVQKELVLCRDASLQDGDIDTCEMEKFEALQGALECLENLPHARVSAAIRLLEHLAERKAFAAKQ